jgi:hypothetical protein
VFALVHSQKAEVSVVAAQIDYSTKERRDLIKGKVKSMNKSYSHLENHTRSMDLEFLLIDLVSSRDKFSKAVVNYNFIKED